MVDGDDSNEDDVLWGSLCRVLVLGVEAKERFEG